MWKSVVPHQEEWRRGLRHFSVGSKSFNGYEHNKVWRGNGDGTFTEIGWAAGGDVVVDCRSCAIADFDRDGRLDVAVRALFERASFLHNEGEPGRFLHVRLVGTRSNRMGVGARVTAEMGRDRFAGELACGSGFLSQSEPAVHLGLGRHERVDRLVVRWPSGLMQEFRNVPADRFVTVTEGESDPVLEAARPPALPPPRADDPLRRILREGAFRDLDGRPAAGTLPAPVTLLHVWSPSCESCASEAPTLNALRALEEGGRCSILSIAVDATVEDARAFAAKHGLKHRILVADDAAGRALAAIPDDSWRKPHRSFDGLITIDEAAGPAVPWSGVVDRSGLRRCYRGALKYFEAKQDLLAATADK